MHWWERQVGGLQQGGKILNWVTDVLSDDILSLGLVEAMGLFVYSKG